jgi:hypothetical protein
VARLGSSPRNDDFAKAARTLPCGSLVGASHCLNIHPATPISGMNLVSGLEASPDAFGIVVGLIAGELSGVVVHPLAPHAHGRAVGTPCASWWLTRCTPGVGIMTFRGLLAQSVLASPSARHLERLHSITDYLKVRVWGGRAAISATRITTYFAPRLGEGVSWILFSTWS